MTVVLAILFIISAALSVFLLRKGIADKREYVDKVDQLTTAFENDKKALHREYEERFQAESNAIRAECDRRIYAEKHHIESDKQLLMAKSEKELLVDILYHLDLNKGNEAGENTVITSSNSSCLGSMPTMLQSISTELSNINNIEEHQSAQISAIENKVDKLTESQELLHDQIVRIAKLIGDLPDIVNIAVLHPREFSKIKKKITGE